MPDGYQSSGPQKVVYQTAEDNLADTVKPRLLAAGADCSKIAYIVDDGSLTLEDVRIEEIIKQTDQLLFDASVRIWSMNAPLNNVFF